MKVTEEIWEGIAGLIQYGIEDALGRQEAGTLTPDIVVGISHNLSSQICQNLAGAD